MTGRPGGKHERFAWAYRLRDGKIFTFSETQRFSGSRNEIRHEAARYAVSRIERYFDSRGSR
ncbi:hypothetical protein H3V53_07850 [Paraburkholderia bengalensis]|uniref:AP2 domain-containing protein n=1 Tax=Paraburkholderia bengalensis TaxID=2747562 RepID=A0ABU8INX4_9BURK